MSTAMVVRASDGRVVGEVSERRAAVAAPAPEADFGQLLSLAHELVPTGFLPKHVKTPGQAVAIILAGREMGIPPMLALRSIALVEGKVTIAADLQLARFKADGGRAQFTELTPARAVLWLRHPNGDEHTESFSMEEAKAAGLAGKDNWRKYPKAMLRSRVITAGLKSVGYEPMSGAYDPDEVGAPAVAADPSPVAGETTTQGPETTRGASATTSTATGGRSTSEGDAPRGTLEWARALPFPFRNSPKHRQPLGSLARSEVDACVRWAAEKMAEAKAEGRDPSATVVDLHAAALVVLEDLDKAQGSLGLDGSAPSAPAVEEDTVESLSAKLREAASAPVFDGMQRQALEAWLRSPHTVKELREELDRIVNGEESAVLGSNSDVPF